MVPNPLTRLPWNRPPQFDRCVRNALPAVENIRRNERVGWAGIKASRARSAAIRRRCIRCQFEIGQDASQKQPRARALIDDAGVLSKPSDTGVMREYTLGQ